MNMDERLAKRVKLSGRVVIQRTRLCPRDLAVMRDHKSYGPISRREEMCELVVGDQLLARGVLLQSERSGGTYRDAGPYSPGCCETRRGNARTEDRDDGITGACSSWRRRRCRGNTESIGPQCRDARDTHASGEKSPVSQEHHGPDVRLRGHRTA